MSIERTMVRIKGPNSSSSSTKTNRLVRLIWAAIVLGVVWMFHSTMGTTFVPPGSGSKTAFASAPASSHRATVETLLSRDVSVKVTTDVRGNLGPPEVMIQEHPGTDWLKDRWQAASDMHGTAIPGVHWVVLEFPKPVTCSRVVLDWEAAFARDYRIEVSDSGNDDDWVVLFDSHVDAARRSSQEIGQSPGVKTKTPLHIIHTITLPETAPSFRYFRLYIRKSAMGWGVSLWQLDVFGSNT